MTQTTAAPTGRRKITLPMLSARAALPPHHSATSPGKALSAFKRASNALGIPRRVVELVDYLVGRTFAADWHSGKVVAWPSNSTLCDALDIGRSQIKTLIRVGQELGLFEMRDAPNGQRYGHRDEDGRITIAYGFDLAPLARRQIEFEQIARAHAERRAEGGRLRSQITAARNAILSLCDMAREDGMPGCWDDVDADARRIAHQRGSSYDPTILTQILEALTQLHNGATEALTPVEPVDKPSDQLCATSSFSVNTDPMGPENRPSLTPTKRPSITKVITKSEMDGPKQPKVILRAAATAAPVETGKREGRQGSALRGFIVTPDFILKVAPIFRHWLTTINPTWRDMLEASFMVRSALGISQHAWGQACITLGQTEAIATLAAIASKHEAGMVKSPGGLLRTMVDRHLLGQLRLDRTLFGLADRLQGVAH